jgi:thiosulfate/3-mercaptopyruvate sulfurtransferase
MLDLANHPLIETDWLAAHLDDAGLRIVDARWRGDGSGRQLYLAGHIPGAVHLDWDRDLSYTSGHVRNLLVPPERFAAAMAAAGIGDDTGVVAYAETDHSGAARLWWALRYYGHDQVAVLNGGLTKWTAEGRPLSADIPQPSSAAAIRLSHRFTPRPQPDLLATAAEVERALAEGSGQSGVRLVDTRPPEQYAGRAVWTPAGSLYLPHGQDGVQVAGTVIRGGRITGAVHLHSSANLDPEDWTYLTADALRDRALTAGVRPEQRVITYCGVGISASLGLFALHLAGYRNLALYDASWAEWGTDPTRPVERDE